LVIGDGHLGAVLAFPSHVTEGRGETENDKIKEMKVRERMTEVKGRKY